MRWKITGMLGFGLLFFVSPVVAQDLGPHFLKIRDGIYVYGRDDIPGRDPTSNCGIIITQEGVVLIDSGPNPPDSLIILEAVKKLTSQPIRFLINTETHNDHTTGNFVFSPPAVVIAAAGATAGIKEYYSAERNREIDGPIERNARRLPRLPSGNAPRRIYGSIDPQYGRSDFRALTIK